MIKIVRGEMVKDGRWRRTVGGGGEHFLQGTIWGAPPEGVGYIKQ